MLKSADYIYDNIIIADEVNTSKAFCKKAQVGVDLSVRKVFKIKTAGKIYRAFSDVSQYEEVELQNIGEIDGEELVGWNLPQGTYLLELNEGVNIPEDIACHIIQRSSLSRSGGMVFSGLWDNGYTSASDEGVNAITVRLNIDTPLGLILEKNARVAQIIAFSTEKTDLYNGQFQGGLLKSNLV